MISLISIIPVYLSALFISLILSRKPFRFFFLLILINFLLNIFGFILSTHHLDISPNLVYTNDYNVILRGLNSAIIGNLLISIAFSSLIEWSLTGKKKILLLVIFISCVFSLLFIFGMWLLTNAVISISRYHVIPAMSLSLLITGLMVAIYERGKIFYPLRLLIVISFIILIYNISKNEITNRFSSRRVEYNQQIQESLRKQVLSYIPQDRIRNNMLFYFKTASGTDIENHLESVFDWKNLTYWMHIKRSYITNEALEGCIAIVWDKLELQKMLNIQEGSKGFLYNAGSSRQARCVHDSIVDPQPNGIFFKLDDFYAFTIEEQNLKDITTQTKDQLLR